jgi:DNA polymerase-3 subunit epsilon
MIKDYIAVDVETTGLNPGYDRLIEVAAIKVKDFNVADTYTTLINPEIHIPGRITEITGISNDMVSSSPKIGEIIHEITEFCGEYILLGHNIRFDYGFLKQNCANHKISFEKQGIDTLKIARKMLPDIEKRSLGFLTDYFGIEQEIYHRAYDDANSTHLLYKHLLHSFSGTDSDIFRPMQLQFQPQKMCPITPKQKVYLNNLIKYHKINVKLEISSLTKSEASRMIDKIIFTYGRC